MICMLWKDMTELHDRLGEHEEQIRDGTNILHGMIWIDVIWVTDMWWYDMDYMLWYELRDYMMEKGIGTWYDFQYMI